MAINKITATEGNWLFNGEGFAKEVSGFGDLSKWSEVTDDYKTQWEAEHANPEVPEIGGNFLTEVPDDGKVYGRTYGEWVEDEDGAVYELIEDITLEEAVQKIVRRTEPDGTPYNFKRMMVYLKKPSTAIGTSYRQVFFIDKSFMDYDIHSFSIMANVTDDHLTLTTAKNRNGYWHTEMACQNINGVGRPFYGNIDLLQVTEDNNRILGYQVSCRESVLFEAGTNIKIYGIR